MSHKEMEKENIYDEWKKSTFQQSNNEFEKFSIQVKIIIFRQSGGYVCWAMGLFLFFSAHEKKTINQKGESKTMKLRVDQIFEIHLSNNVGQQKVKKSKAIQESFAQSSSISGVKANEPPNMDINKRKGKRKRSMPIFQMEFARCFLKRNTLGDKRVACCEEM
ncbi:CLUMA_CG004359, isoform A [Clunio marinus]|uniref:CLUMA_CG004359, isoform A n=1 Tax=Clunio marinus TaxID=568069 RepID=A0A1J1HSY2_9DIPT|nr:CLUMA_CG004359, isoform A [Clunio marinus]